MVWRCGGQILGLFKEVVKCEACRNDGGNQEQKRRAFAEKATSQAALVHAGCQQARHSLVDEMDDCHEDPDGHLYGLMPSQTAIVVLLGIVAPSLRSTI